MRRPARGVGATYRLQFNRSFTFDAAAAIAEYLAALGVTHVYCSPFFAATPGSRHGYDIVDYQRVNPELGGEAGWSRFIAALSRAGLGLVIDMVPNHMSIASHRNAWWTDVLERGASSRYAKYFDVDWQPSDSRFDNTILMPVLADHYGVMLEQGNIQLARDEGRVWVAYESHRFPVAEDTLSLVRRDGESLEAMIDRVNHNPDSLHVLLQAQPYRLARWRVANRELGYRRFFDVNTLIGMRMERRRVFAETHRLLQHWVDDGVVDGIRVDHVDGLRDPQQYLERLRAIAPGAWIVVEKILRADESLPATWPVNGSTGYDVSARLIRLFVDAAGHHAIVESYGAFTGEATAGPARARECKLRVLRDVLGADVNRIAGLLAEICERHREYRDYSRHELTEGLLELVAALGVYRTYVRPALSPVRPIDRAHLERAAFASVASRPDLEPQLFEFLFKLACGDLAGPLESEFVWRLQQLSVAAMAKGVEDTFFYAWTPFLPLNDVGHEPADGSLPVAEFHQYLAAMSSHWPDTMSASTTHDSKRSEDVRARLVVLSYRVDDWRAAVARWSSWLAPHRAQDQPSRQDEYYFYQTLIGAWPISLERLIGHTQKAAREAKTRTSWTTPDVRYESALRRFIEGALSDERFMADVEAFVAPMIAPGRLVSLALSLIRCTALGVPDLYQGNEVWNLKLVDPDNRSAVDFTTLQKVLGAAAQAAQTPLDGDDLGLLKMWLIHQALQLRRKRPEAFAATAPPHPLEVRGVDAGQVIAYVRGSDVVAVAPLRTWDTRSTWATTTVEIPQGRWLDVLTQQDVVGGMVVLDDLWKAFPITLLERLPE